MEAELAAKLKQLKLNAEKWDTLTQKGNLAKIERHRESLNEIIKATEHSRKDVEGQKIADGVEDDELAKWNAEIEDEIDYADNKLLEMFRFLKEKERQK